MNSGGENEGPQDWGVSPPQDQIKAIYPRAWLSCCKCRLPILVEITPGRIEAPKLVYCQCKSTEKNQKSTTRSQ